jgi:uncharacterized protein (TIGR00369 family)
MTAVDADAVTRSRTVTWQDPAPTRAAGASLSGLELWRAIAAGELPPPPVARLLSFDRIASVEEGLVVFAMEPAEEHLNPLGTVHGGVLTTLLDSAMGCAVHTTLPAGVLYTTLELKVNFLRPALAGGAALLAEGHVLHRGSTVALADAQIRSADSGKLVAHATSTCLIKPVAGP